MNNEDIYGWLTPSRNFICISAYDHIKEIRKNPELSKYVSLIDEKWREVESVEEECKDSIKQGEQPEWHCYEKAIDYFGWYVVNEMYSKGCLRIGTAKDEMCFEGTSQGIKNLYQTAIDLAESYDKKAKFEVSV